MRPLSKSCRPPLLIVTAARSEAAHGPLGRVRYTYLHLLLESQTPSIPSFSPLLSYWAGLEPTLPAALHRMFCHCGFVLSFAPLLPISFPPAFRGASALELSDTVASALPSLPNFPFIPPFSSRRLLADFHPPRRALPTNEPAHSPPDWGGGASVPSATWFTTPQSVNKSCNSINRVARCVLFKQQAAALPLLSPGCQLYPPLLLVLLLASTRSMATRTWGGGGTVVVAAPRGADTSYCIE